MARAFEAAKAGQTICLAPGHYGTFRAGAKSGPVTVRSRSERSASMALAFDGAANVHIDHVTVTSADIATSRNVTVSHSRFTGIAVIRAGQIPNASIVFDANTHIGIDACSGCFAGRVHVVPAGPQPSGVTIEHSLFDGGTADGVRADAVGERVLDNEFRNFPDRGEAHTDPIQIYGGRHVLIRGNYLHGNAVSAPILMANGGAHNVVEDNLITGPGYTWAVTWLGDDGSIIRHNTFPDGACNFGVRCGIINLGGSGAPTGSGTIIRDNVLGGVSGDSAAYSADHNLTRIAIPGPANLTALPTYVRTGNGTASYRLAPGSRGAHGASDRTDPGIQ